MQKIPISGTHSNTDERIVPVVLMDEATDSTPQTVASISGSDVQLSINGAPLANAQNTSSWVSVGSGLHTYTLAAAECAAIGFVALIVDITNIRTFVTDVQVVNDTAVD